MVDALALGASVLVACEFESHLVYQIICSYGEKGRRARFKSLCPSGVLVRVQVGAPKNMEDVRLVEDTALKAAGCKRLAGSIPVSSELIP